MTNPLPKNNISFENTAQAFEYKTTKELNQSRWLFSCMGNRLLTHIGLVLMPIAIKYKLPFVRYFIKKTIFKQFVGGESLAETIHVVNKLAEHNVQVILDYGVEGGVGNTAFDEACTQFIKVIEYASLQPNIPFISIKITGIGSFQLLEKMDQLMLQQQPDLLITRYSRALNILEPNEKTDWEKIVQRLTTICESAYTKKVAVLIDAEESWIQEPIDALSFLMMQQYNQEKAFVYNTIQLYRHDRLQFLKNCYHSIKNNSFILGVKLVRGAYMEKERKRANALSYPSPIQKDKTSSDFDYNLALEFCINHLHSIAIIVASHNDYSNLYATILLEKSNLSMQHPHVHFSQLYGMSDNITFNLAKAGCSVSKYLPFGPIDDVIPYLMRRAQENSSVAGQTGRELSLINQELKRRGI